LVTYTSGCAAVVEIPDADTLPPPLVGDAGCRGCVAEPEVALVTKQRGTRRLGAAIERGAVDEVDIEPSVAVEVEERHPEPVVSMMWFSSGPPET
jgi:hypothetical protein